MPLDYAIGGEKWTGMSKLIEEMGELQQILGKLMQLDGSLEHWDGNLAHPLIDELGDVRAAIIFFCERNNISKLLVHIRADEKLAKFNRWHKEQSSVNQRGNAGIGQDARTRSEPETNKEVGDN